MKKVFQSFILSLAALAFSACNNSNQNKPDEPASNPFIGIWVKDVANADIVGGYTEFGKDGVLTLYGLNAGLAAYEEGGYIQVLQETSWKEDYAMKYTYDESAQAIWVSDIKGTIEMVSNDEFVLLNSIGLIYSGTYRRIKGFKTVEVIEGKSTSGYYQNGREPVIDVNKGTINGHTYNNTEKHCFMYTVKTTTMGITTSEADWFWGTEFELVATLEEKMYVVANSGNGFASYNYCIEVGADQDRCEELSDRAN